MASDVRNCLLYHTPSLCQEQDERRMTAVLTYLVSEVFCNHANVRLALDHLNCYIRK